MKGEHAQAARGFRYDIIARFSCNVSGVHVAVRKTPLGAKRFAKRFAKLNRVVWVTTRLRYDPFLDGGVK